MAEQNVWKRLTQLFRSGPVVRHKIARAEPNREPTGTARIYKKPLSALYTNSMAAAGQYERLSRYADYREMCFMPELASGLDIYAEEICAEDEQGHMIRIESKNDEIKQVLETLFFDIIDINYNLFTWVRNACMNGDFVLLVDANEDNGILNLLPIPINEIEREEGFDRDDPFAVRYRWLGNGNQILQNWQVIHFRLLGDDSYLPYGYSILEPARRIWRQLVLLEDAMLVYRIVRSPERRVFKVPVGNISPDEVDRYMQDFISSMKRNTIVDPSTGRVDLRYNALSVEDDIFIPTRGDVGATVDPLPGGQFTGDIEDVEYIQKKLFAALKIPRAYLGYDQDVGSKATLAQEDVRFAKTINRIQKVIIGELNKIAIIHLFLMGYEGQDLTEFQIKMATPSTIAEQQKLELWRMRFEVAGMAQEGMLDQDTVREKIFGMNEKEIATVKDRQKLDKLHQMSLEAVQAPGDAAPGGGGAEGADSEVPGTPLDTGGETPGEDQLPNTLGGAPGLDTAGVDGVDDPLVEVEEQDEAFNPGSSGDRAEVAVDKGKNLFSPDEDLFTAVFGTEKQTSSDPFDLRAQRRMVTRPMSEEDEEDPDDLESFESLVAENHVKNWITNNIQRSSELEDIMKTLERRSRAQKVVGRPTGRRKPLLT